MEGEEPLDYRHTDKGTGLGLTSWILGMVCMGKVSIARHSINLFL